MAPSVLGIYIPESDSDGNNSLIQELEPHELAPILSGFKKVFPIIGQYLSRWLWSVHSCINRGNKLSLVSPRKVELRGNFKR